jgi:hypothetical protein
MATDTLEFTTNRAQMVDMPDGRAMLITYDPIKELWTMMYEVDVNGEQLFRPVPFVNNGDLVWLSTSDALDLLVYEARNTNTDHRASFARVLWDIRTSDSLEV